MEILDYYDWAILGDHPAAISAAVDLSRLGYSVIYFPFTQSALSRVTVRGQFFDPESNTLIGLKQKNGENSFLGNYFKDLDIYESIQKSLNSKDAELQLLHPEHRIKLSSEPGQFHLELLKDYGSKFIEQYSLDSVISALLDDFENVWLNFYKDPQSVSNEEFYLHIISSLKKIFKKNKKLNSIGLSSDYKKTSLFYHYPETLPLISGALYFGFKQLSEDPKLYYGLLGLLQSVYFSQINGGKSVYRKILLQKALKEGLNYFPDIKTDCLFVKDGKLIGCQINKSGKMIGLGGAFYSGTLDNLTSSLNFSGSRKSENLLKKPPQVDGWKFTMSFTVNKEALPPHLPRVGVWKERNAPPIEYEIIDPVDYSFHLNEDYFFFVRTVLPFTQESLSSQFQQIISARMFRQIREVFPFVEFQIKNIFPDFRNGLRGMRNDYFEAYPYKELTDVPENLRVYGYEGVGYRSGITGLYLCSNEAYPMLGEFGPFLSYKTALKEHRKLK